MPQTITCVRVGVYEDALTRGQQYELLARHETENQVRVRGDNGRTRWYHEGCFDLAGGPAATLVSWRFDDLVENELNERDETYNCVDVTVVLSDGTERWCCFVTPDYLKRRLEPPGQPAIWGAHIIVVRNLAVATVDGTLNHLDQQGELIQHSLLLERDNIPPESDIDQGAVRELGV